MATLEQQIAAQEAKLARLRDRARAADRNKKIIVGALALKAAESSPGFARHLGQFIAANASERDRERLGDVLDQLRELGAQQQPQPGQQG